MKIEFPVYHDRTLNVVKTDVSKDPMKPVLTRELDYLKNIGFYSASSACTASYYGDHRDTSPF